MCLIESRSPSCTLFDIGALFRSRSHPLYLTESRSPLLCHRQRSYSVLRNSQIKNLPPVLCSISACCFAPAHITCISQKVALPSVLCSISARCFAPAHITCISQKVALPFSATGSGRAYFSHWRRSFTRPLFVRLVSYSARYSVQNQRGASPSLAPLVFHGTSFSFLLSLAAVVLGSSQLTDKKSPFSRHWRRSFTCPLFVRLVSLALLATPFKIGAVLRLLSHLLFFTEPRSPFSCHWQQSHSVLHNSQIKNLPSPATGGGRFFIPIFWRQQQSYRPES